jgi:Fe-S-cluster containining protein
MLSFLRSLLQSRRQPKPPPTCLQCGECCELYGWHLHASSRDLKRWQEHGRQDLVDSTNELGWIWVDPVTKARVEPCPHIDRSDPEHVRCGIHEIKPDICRDYPTLAHGKRCLRGVFLSGWSTLSCGPLAQWVVILDDLPVFA